MLTLACGTDVDQHHCMLLASVHALSISTHSTLCSLLTSLPSALFSVVRDEWVEVDSKRIQPSYAVGDKLTVLDSVNKESECVVMDVQVKENQLKLLIHYIGWGEKW
jgi:hypothetical protein